MNSRATQMQTSICLSIRKIWSKDHFAFCGLRLQEDDRLLRNFLHLAFIHSSVNKKNRYFCNHGRRLLRRIIARRSRNLLRSNKKQAGKKQRQMHQMLCLRRKELWSGRWTRSAKEIPVAQSCKWDWWIDQPWAISTYMPQRIHS